MNSNFESICILGTTASGKTNLATNLAYTLKNGAIISADSRQVYKGLNIGAGKDLEEYVVNGMEIPYYLIDIVPISEMYHIAQFKKNFEESYESILDQNKVPIICGGSGMYLQTALSGYPFANVPVDESLRGILDEYSSKEELIEYYLRMPNHQLYLVDFNSKKRLIRAIEVLMYLDKYPDFEIDTTIKMNTLIFGLAPEREERRERIAKRLLQRFEKGLIEEVEGLLKMGIPAERLKFFGLEYKFVMEYLEKALEKDEMIEKLTIAIQQFAKRQMTWFRKMEKDGFEINWISNELNLEEKMLFCLNKFYN